MASNGGAGRPARDETRRRTPAPAAASGGAQPQAAREAERLQAEVSGGDWSRSYIFGHMRQKATTLPSVVATGGAVKSFKLSQPLNRELWPSPQWDAPNPLMDGTVSLWAGGGSHNVPMAKPCEPMHMHNGDRCRIWNPLVMYFGLTTPTDSSRPNTKGGFKCMHCNCRLNPNGYRPTVSQDEGFGVRTFELEAVYICRRQPGPEPGQCPRPAKAAGVSFPKTSSFGAADPGMLQQLPQVVQDDYQNMRHKPVTALTGVCRAMADMLECVNPTLNFDQFEAATEELRSRAMMRRLDMLASEMLHCMQEGRASFFQQQRHAPPPPQFKFKLHSLHDQLNTPSAWFLEKLFYDLADAAKAMEHRAMCAVGVTASGGQSFDHTHKVAEMLKGGSTVAGREQEQLASAVWASVNTDVEVSLPCSAVLSSMQHTAFLVPPPFSEVCSLCVISVCVRVSVLIQYRCTVHRR